MVRGWCGRFPRVLAHVREARSAKGCLGTAEWVTRCGRALGTKTHDRPSQACTQRLEKLKNKLSIENEPVGHRVPRGAPSVSAGRPCTAGGFEPRLSDAPPYNIVLSTYSEPSTVTFSLRTINFGSTREPNPDPIRPTRIRAQEKP